MEFGSSSRTTSTASSFYSSKASNLSKIEALNQSARAIILQKDAEIERLNREIDEAEQYLEEHGLSIMNSKGDLQSAISDLKQELLDIQSKSEQDVEFLKQRQQREIEKLKEKYEEEIKKIKYQIVKTQNNQTDILNKQKLASEMRKKTYASLTQNIDDNVASSETTSTFVDPEYVNAQKRAAETQKEVEDLEKQLNDLVQQQKDKEMQIQQEKEEALKKRAQAKQELQQKKLQEKENEYKNQIEKIKQQYDEEMSKLQSELQQVSELNTELDDELEKVLAENTAKAHNLHTLKNKPLHENNTSRISKKRYNTPNTTISSSSISVKKNGKKKVSRTSSTIKSEKSKNYTISDLTFVEAEIIRLTEENDDLRKELRRLDKLAYLTPPK